MVTGSIYIIRNTVNDKVYIGQTTMTVEERFNSHKKPSTEKQKKNYKIYNAMRKYGRDKFYVETLETGISADKLDEREIEYIAQYDSFRNGYNSTPGGDGRILNKINCEDELLSLAKNGVSADELATRYGVNKATIFRTLHKCGFYYRTDHKEILDLAKSGLKNKEIAKILHCNEATVSRALKNGGKRKHRVPINARESFDYDALISDYYSQIPMKELCDKYGITKTSFYRIKEKIGFETRPQIYKHKTRYYEKSVKCNDYGDSSSRPEDELLAEVR